jgi:hypothetical protein
MSKMPKWSMPDNLNELLAEDDDGIWEDDRWEPILLTVLTGTSLDGRDIPRAWQIEFEPDDDAFESANARLQELGIEPDGYGWGDAIRDAVAKTHPEFADQLHLGDCETGTCVVWVESENACRLLVEETWKLIFGA